MPNWQYAMILEKPTTRFPLLEWLTTAVLLLVLLSLCWMVLAAAWPEGTEAATLDVQVWIVVVLLSAALLLVSIVALLHTR